MKTLQEEREAIVELKEDVRFLTVQAWREEKSVSDVTDEIMKLLSSRDTYWKERVGDVKFDIEALRGSPRDTDIEYARAITDVHKILDTLLDNLK